MKTKRLLKGVGIALAAVLSLALAVLVATPLIIFNKMFDHRNDYEQLFSGEEFGVEVQEHFVTTADGLSIALYEVEVPHPKAVVLTLSGIERPSTTAYVGHAALFREHGYATLMVEMRAHGRSEGDRICLGFKEPLDAGAAMEYAHEKYPGVPVVVMGLSMGAATAINTMAQYPEIDALISLSSYSSCEEIFCDVITKTIIAAEEAEEGSADVLVQAAGAGVSGALTVGRSVSEAQMESQKEAQMESQGDAQMDARMKARMEAQEDAQMDARMKARMEAQEDARAAVAVLKPFLRLGTFIRYGFPVVRLKPIKSIKKLNGRPALLLHTTDDSVVPYSHFLRLQAAAPDHVECHVFERNEHFVTPEFFHPQNDPEYTALLLDFLGRVALP